MLLSAIIAMGACSDERAPSSSSGKHREQRLSCWCDLRQARNADAIHALNNPTSGKSQAVAPRNAGRRMAHDRSLKLFRNSALPPGIL